MASWDMVLDIKRLLDSYSEATGDTYLLLVAQGSDETPRVVAKSMAAFPDGAGPVVLMALEEAASDIFDEIEAHMGFPGEGDIMP